MGPTYNADNKPLEEVFIEIEEDGVKKKVAALSKQFATGCGPCEYVKPPQPREDGSFPLGAKESWLASTELVVQDLTYLLSLPHHRFWSELVYNEDSLDCLVKFLQEAFPYYSLEESLPSDLDVTHLYHRTCNLAFLLVNRILTRNETQNEWIGEEKYSSLLYNKYIMSVPLLLDLCIVYGKSNPDRLRQLLDFVFTVQPFYKEDLRKMIQSVIVMLEGVKERVWQGSSGGCGGEMGGEVNTAAELEDLLLFLVDISSSLLTLSTLCPLTTVYMHRSRLHLQVALFYSNVMGEVSNLIKRLCQGDSQINSYISTVLKMNLARYNMVELFYQCLVVSLDTSLQLWNWTEEEVVEEVDDRLDILSECLAEKTFIRDLHCRYPLHDIIHKLSSLSNHLDATKVKLMLSSLPAVCGAARTNRSGGPPMPSSTAPMSTSATPVHTAPTPSNQDVDKPGSSAPVEDSIKELKEIFPHLGEGFLMKCFEYYGNSCSVVLNAILEGSLAEELSLLDPGMPVIPPDPDEERPLPHRVNVFDNDQFDVMTHDRLDMSRVRTGKTKPQYRDLSEMLNDKCVLKDVRERYNEYSNTYTDLDVDEYDDEYDDSYDSVLPLPDQSDDPYTLPRSFVTPRVLEQSKGRKKEEVGEEEEEDEEEEEVTEGGSSAGGLAFAEDPALVRERWNRRHNTQSRDYTGKPKGQGQDSDVLFNRHKKNVNKSSGANHNRRRQARNKRMRGMVPSKASINNTPGERRVWD